MRADASMSARFLDLESLARVWNGQTALSMKLRYFFGYRASGGARGFRRPGGVSLRNCDYYSGARFLPMPAIAVLYRRIEIDSVLGPQLKFLASNLDG